MYKKIFIDKWLDIHKGYYVEEMTKDLDYLIQKEIDNMITKSKIYEFAESYDKQDSEPNAVEFLRKYKFK